MQIQSVKIYHIKIPLKKPFKHASAERTEAENIIIRIQSACGKTGWGETIPRPYVTGETINETLKRYRAIPSSVWAVPIKSIEDVRALLASASLEECLAARCGIECALIDVLAKSAGKPVSTYLTDACSIEINKLNVSPFCYSGAIGLLPPMKTVKKAALFRFAGFKSVKIKLEKDMDADVRRLKHIRMLLGEKIGLRVDANEAWDCEYAMRIAPVLKRYGVAGIEQPFPKERFGDNAVLSSAVDIPIILDESLCSLPDAQRAVDAGINVVFCVKLPKCGGFLNALEIFALAKKHAVPVLISCQVGETAVLSAAGRHLAAVCPTLRWLEGSFDRFLLTRNITDTDISFGWGGKAPSLNGAGLGIQVNETALEAVSIDTLQVYP